MTDTAADVREAMNRLKLARNPDTRLVVSEMEKVIAGTSELGPKFDKKDYQRITMSYRRAAIRGDEEAMKIAATELRQKFPNSKLPGVKVPYAGKEGRKKAKKK